MRGIKGSGKAAGRAAPKGHGAVPGEAPRNSRWASATVADAPATSAFASGGGGTGSRCRVCDAPLQNGNCPACAWRAKRYAGVAAFLESGVCECGAPIKGRETERGTRFAKRCPPCRKLHVKAKAIERKTGTDPRGRVG